MTSAFNKFSEEFKKNTRFHMRNEKTNKFLRSVAYSDIPIIKKLHNHETDFYFGSDTIIEEILEVTIASKVILDSKKKVIAFGCCDVAPNIPALDSSVADKWIHYFYDIEGYKNIHYVRYLVFEPNIHPEVLRPLFNEIFLRFHTLSHLILLEPPIKQEDNEKFYLYRKILGYWCEPICSKFVPPNVAHIKLYALKHQNFLAPLRFRIAIADDNDALVDIFDKKYPEMKKEGGEFHVAEQILKEDPNITYILMENNEEVYGAMLVNKEVDVDYLNENFDLALCDHLKRAEVKPVKNLKVFKDVVMRKTTDFFESNYFNLKPRVYENRRATKFETGKFRRNDDDSSEDASMEDLNEMLLSKSFELNDDLSESSVSSETLQNLWKPEDKELVDNNPNLIFRDKEVLIPKGKSNAFMIEKYASNIEERRIFELFRASFSLCTDKDYCVTLVDPSEKVSSTFNYFTFVPKRPYSECNLCLYIAHRNTVMHLVKLTEGQIQDIPDVERFLKINNVNRCEEADTIFQRFKESVTSYRRDYHSAIIRSSKAIIGLVILQTENRLHKLRKYFYLDSFHKFNHVADPLLHGRILYLINLPLFNNTYRLIFNNLRKFTSYKFYYYAIEDVEYLKIYNNLLAKMCPVLPTDVYDVFDKRDIQHRTYSQDFKSYEPSYPLFYQSFKFSECFFKNIDLRILCIGFDDVCKGFLKKLIFDPKYLFIVFENIVVLTQAGDFECQTTKVYDCVYKLLNWRTRNNPTSLRRLGLRVFVNFHSGKVIALDRHYKTVFLRDNTRFKYDYLILTCSVDFGYPGLTKWDSIVPPSNFEVICSAMEAALFVHKITILKKAFPRGFDIIVYGNALQAYACINYLLEKGIPGYNIHFVLIKEELEDELNVSGFRDKNLEEYILQIIRNFYVNIHNGYRFVCWTVEEKSQMITSITFSSKFNIITLKCRLFVCYNSRSLQRVYKKVFQRSGLLIDGRLVIDENYKLNDPYIFAAGPITQYKRILFAHKFDHYYYDCIEVGGSLTDKFCAQILNSTDKTAQIPNFSFPNVTQVFLPGGYLYISITTCGPILPLYISKQFKKCMGTSVVYDDGIKFKSSDIFQVEQSRWESDFFRLSFFGSGRIRTLICLTPCKNTSLDFFAEIFKTNYTTLDMCTERWKNGLFHMDPLKYFTKSWVNAIIYPRFHELRCENMLVMVNSILSDAPIKKITADYLEAKNKVTLTPDEVLAIRNSVNNETTIRQLEHNLLKFINDNSHHLFMYKRCDLETPYFLKYLKDKN